jgi:hypothetical protein
MLLRPRSFGFDLAENSGNLSLAEGKGRCDLTPQKQSVGELAEGAEWHFVFDVICDEVHINAAAVHSAHPVAVVPISEGAADLSVAKMSVPGEFRDFSLPVDADRRERERAKAEG